MEHKDFSKKVGLRILNLRMDTNLPTGKLMLTVLGGIAQFKQGVLASARYLKGQVVKAKFLQQIQ